MLSTGLKGVGLVYDCVSAVYRRVMSPCRFLFICYAKAAEGPNAAVGEWCRKVIE